MLVERGGEHVVDDELGAMRLGDLGDGLDVDQLERRVGRRLDEHHLGVRPHRLLEIGGVAPIDQRRGHAQARHQVLDDVAAAAEQRAGRDDMVAGAHLAHHRIGDRRHAGGEGARRLGAFEQRHAVLEHVERRVREARVVVPRRSCG